MHKRLDTAIRLLTLLLLAGVCWRLVRVEQRLGKLEEPKPKHIVYSAT